MLNIENINHQLISIGKKYQIPNITLSVDGNIGLKLKNGLEIYLACMPDNNQIFVYTPIAPFPVEEKHRCQLFERLLNLNLLGRGAYGGGFSIADEYNSVIFQVNYSEHDLAIMSLESIFEDFMDRAKLLLESQLNLIKPTDELKHSNDILNNLSAV